MRSIGMVVFLLASLAGAADGSKEPKRVLEVELRPGSRFVGYNRVSYTLRTVTRTGIATETTRETVQRTERFLDHIVRVGHGGVFEIERTYNMAQGKVQSDENKRKTLKWSPMNGRTVRISERARKRDVKLDGRGVVDAFTRRTVGMEIDWRDIFIDRPVGPGDEWDAETVALGRRMAAYLNSGDKSRMRVRYEENIERDGRKLAKLYVDWVLEGMRDRHLYTKVVLAGEIYFDFALQRIVEIDLGGSMSVNGIIMDENKHRIVKGEGPLALESSLKPTEAPTPPVEANPVPPVRPAAPGADPEADSGNDAKDGDG